MLTIARTLMGNPRLLLLDETSEGIASVIVDQLADTILRLKAEGLSIVISEQDLQFARMVADWAIIIESGAKKFDGTFAELNQRPDVRDAYLSIETGSPSDRLIWRRLEHSQIRLPHSQSFPPC